MTSTENTNCPAGGEHDYEWNDTGDSGRRPYRFFACANCGASAPKHEDDEF